MPHIRVYLVDDHEIVRRGLSAFLDTAADVAIVGETGDGHVAIRDLISLDESNGVDVLLTDLMMPALSGFDLLQQVKSLSHPPRVIVLSAYGDSERVRRAFDLDAAGYVKKSARPDSILEAIRAAANGRQYVDPELAVQLAQGSLDPDVPSLTPREREVVTLVAQGMSNLDIAHELFISERTARTHVSHVLGKLGFESRIQLALWALDGGRGNDQA
ncbi:response regulator [Subtercola endophyticus]|uniref:response regulator n=1 Tax=Subtercola endophyticus TaxID=2895559 RepID=UPI001E417C38|nr:response regulator transcription factor [Subtercola endophyticus]UFS58735.1 response regulator transcription factor [Subtercola endophyticus]